MAYTTVDKVKKYAQVQYGDLGFTSQTEFDNWIQNTLIPAAESYVDLYTGRTFSQATVTEYYDGNGKNYLLLSKYPVTNISSIKVSGSTIDPNDYTWNRSGLVKLKSKTFPKGVGNIEVTYTYGYATVPAVIDDVTARIAARILQIMVQNKMGILVRIDDFKVQLADYKVITEDIKAVLNRFRGVV